MSMTEYLVKCFDLFFDILASGSMLVWLPFCTLVFSVIFLFTIRLIRGKYHD